MPTDTYRIKFYGHSAKDPAQFLLDFAKVLKTSEHEAQMFMERAPCLVKKNLPRDQAEYLIEQLTSIGVLCLLESHGGKAPADPSGILESNVPDKSTVDRSIVETLHERLFPIFLGLAVFAISIAFLYSYAKSIRQNQQKFTPSKPIQSAAPSQANIEEYENRIADLKLQIGQIETRISDLKMRLQAEEKTNSSRGVEDVEFRRYIGSIRAEIRENSDQLKALNTQLKITEYMLTRANPARDDKPPDSESK